MAISDETTTLSRETLDEIVDLLAPLVLTDTKGRCTLLEQAFGPNSPVLRVVDLSGSVNTFAIGLVSNLAYFGEIEPGKQALWALLETVSNHDLVGADKKLRIEALRDVINVPGRLIPPQMSFDLVEKDYGGRIWNFEQYYLASFGGRQDKLNSLDAWLGQSDKPIATLVAPAGMGKSALVVNWIVRLREQAQAKIVFHPISLRFKTHNRKTVLQSLVFQLAEVFGQPKPRSLDSDSLQTEFLNLLCNPPKLLDQPLIVIIDGLDEIDTAPELIELPTRPADGVHLLVTIRQQEDNINDDYARLNSEFGWLGSIVERLQVTSLSKEELSDVIVQSRIDPAPLTIDALVDKLYELSEGGDPLIAHLYINTLKSSDINVKRMLSKNILPGLKVYIERTEKQLGLQKDDEYNRQFFEALAVAKGALKLCDFEGIRLDMSLSDVAGLVDKSHSLVIGDGGRQGFAFSHQRIGLAYMELHPEKRRKWVDRFRAYGAEVLRSLIDGKRAPSNTPDYAHQYYVKHLLYDPDPQSQAAFALVCKAWMQAHYEKTGSYESFLDDISLVWEAAEKLGPTPEVIGIQVKCALIFSSVASLSSNLPPLLPALLLRDDLWNAAQARAYANRVPDALQRAQTRLALLQVEEAKEAFEARYETQAIASSIIEDIEIIQETAGEPTVAYLLLNLIPHLQRDDQIIRVLEITYGIQKSIWRARLLANLVSRARLLDKQIAVAKELIRACCNLDYSEYGDNFYYVPLIYEAIALNLSMDVLESAWMQIREERQQIVAEIEATYEQEPQDIASIRRAYHNRFDEDEKLKLFFEHLAWHIPSEKAEHFVDILYEHDNLPLVAEKIARLAPRLTDDIALNIATKLKDRLHNSTPQDRKFARYYTETIGCGIAFIALAYNRKDEIYRKNLLQMAKNYIDQYGADEKPISEADLRILYGTLTGQYSDQDTTEMVRQNRFLTRFWHSSSQLRRYSIELIPYLGIETIKVLFERCLVSDSDNDNYNYLFITSSPYIVPAIAEKLSSDELHLIYEIGTGKDEPWASLGCIRAASQNVHRMPTDVLNETIRWALSPINITDPKAHVLLAVAPYITEEIIGATDYYWERRSFAVVAPYLDQDVLRRAFKGASKLGYGSKLDDQQTLVELLQYFPQEERIPILKTMQEEAFCIVESGQSAETISSLASNLPKSKKKAISKINRHAKNILYDAELSRAIKEDGLLSVLLAPFFYLLIYRGASWQRAIGIWIKHSVSLLRKIYRLMFFVDVHAAIEDRLCTNRSEIEWSEEFSGYHQEWPLKKISIALDSFLISSPIIWRTLILIVFLLTFPALFISLIFSLIILVVFVIVWLIELLKALAKSLVIDRSSKSTQDKWKILDRKIDIINNLQTSEQRQQAFVEIAIELGEIFWDRYGFREYHGYYKRNAAEIWTALNPDFVEDAISGIDLFKSQAQDPLSEDHVYIRFLIPLVLTCCNHLRPEIEQLICDSIYKQFYALQYSIEAYFLHEKTSSLLETIQKIEGNLAQAEDPEVVVSILLDVSNEVSDLEVLHRLLDCVDNYPTGKSLAKVAYAIAKNRELLDRAFTIAHQIDSSVHKFICIVAPFLDTKLLELFFIFIIDRNNENEQEHSYACLIQRWLELSQANRFQIWCNILKHIKHYPRERVLTQLSWLSEMVVNLGSEQAAVAVAADIMDVCGWWPVKWS
ncbi:MAG: NACHT domain-containing protein [Candidatus Babeliaceae bacterium]|nr:NACHT domain-containing protein [Candidatus Babeliaceae bacterium]